jgi:hypothetical protein
MQRWLTATFVACVMISGPTAARAEGNLASRPERLELSIDSRTLTFSETEYELETGKYYIWEITHDGLEELMIRSPELFRNSWINQIVINEMEVHTSGAVYGIEFDDEGTLAISFVPIRPGNYEFFAAGFEERGLAGTFVVR